MKKLTEEQQSMRMAELRKTEPRDHLVSAVLTEKQWLIFHELRRALPPNHGLFAGASLSAFFDPTSPTFKQSFPREVFTASTLFAITSKEVEGFPELFVVDEEWASAVLCHLRAPYLCWDERCNPRDFTEKIMNRLTHAVHDWLPAQRKAVNKPEFYAGRQLILNRLADHQFESLKGRDDCDPETLEELKRRHPKLLREVALSRLAPKLHFRLDDDLRSLFDRSNVDILVHAVDPNTPILGIEIDGATHREPAQRAKDAKKDRIFEALQLPLMRVLPDDVTKCLPSEWPHKKEALWYAEMFGRVATLLAHHFRRKHKTYLEFVPLDSALDQAEARLANALYGKPSDLLTDSQRSNLEDKLEDTKAYQDMLLFHQQDFFFRDTSRNSRVTLTWGDSLSRYCAAPTVIKDTEDVWSFRAVFKSSGVSEVVPAPRIKCSASVLGEQEVAEIFGEVFFFYAKSWVENKINETTSRS